jgi:GcrA cell cycle regulator
LSFWTIDRAELLRELWATNSSAIIAEKLGCTRNAVIGKAHRLGLPIKGKSGFTCRRPTQRLVSPHFGVRRRSWLDDALPPPRKPDAADLPIVELKPDQCRFATAAGDVWTHLFCGGSIQSGSAFCAFHHRVVYVPAQQRRAA